MCEEEVGKRDLEDVVLVGGHLVKVFGDLVVQAGGAVELSLGRLVHVDQLPRKVPGVRRVLRLLQPLVQLRLELVAHLARCIELAHDLIVNKGLIKSQETAQS